MVVFASDAFGLMRSTLRRIARRIRHLPALKSFDLFWHMVRRPYQAVLSMGADGVKIVVGGAAPVQIPAEFTGFGWEEYEPEPVAAFFAWLRRHPGSLVLDVGSSFGVYGVVALFADSSAEVVAFDSDLASLLAAQRVCRYASGSRLHVVWGFVAENASEALSLQQAVARTGTILSQRASSLSLGTTQYTCLTDDGIDAIPINRLDDLFSGVSLTSDEVLIKCDVEGAELLVLRGAEALLRAAAPVLLLSVHPRTLPRYGHSVRDVDEFLRRLGYSIRVLSVDHEEHWWCERQ
jgi:FkbM family methyltransferase